MIAKRITGKKGGAGHFRRLVTYISQSHAKDRVGEVRITNSEALTPDVLVQEVGLVQHFGKSKLDKTYHLVISLAPGEKASPEVLHDLEDRLCESIGLEDHQRISVVHHDTEQIHIHIAANLVHPTHYKMAPLHMEKRKLMAMCEELEAEHRLTPTNHGRTRGKKGVQIEAPGRTVGVNPQSLIAYVRETCPDLVEAPTWEALHVKLADAGLEIAKKGPGFVIKAADTAVKASSVDRHLSSAGVTARLGPYKPPAGPMPPPTRQFNTSAPLSSPVPPKDANGNVLSPRFEVKDLSGPERVLYDQFTKERQATQTWKKAETQKIRDAHAAAKQAASRQLRRDRDLSKDMPKGPDRTALQQKAAAKHLEAKAKAWEDSKARARALSLEAAKRPQTEWNKWLQARAAAGDKDALTAIKYKAAPPPGEDQGPSAWELETKARETAEKEAAQALTARERVLALGAEISHITNKGTMVYRIGNATIRDDGSRFHLEGPLSDEGIAATLALAQERHGACLSLRGTHEFRRRAAAIAAATDPSIRFDDTLSEMMRGNAVNLMRKAKYGQNAKPYGLGIPRFTSNAGKADLERIRHIPGTESIRDLTRRAMFSGLSPTHSSAVPFRGQYDNRLGSQGRPTPDSFRGESNGGAPSPRVIPDKPHFSFTTPRDSQYHFGPGNPGAPPEPRLPPDRDGVRDLPDRHVDFDPNEHPVLLQNPGSRDVEPSGTRPDRILLGEGSSPGGSAGGEQERLSASEPYIEERNAKRESSNPIAEHITDQAGRTNLTSAGQRNVGGEPLALSNSGEQVMVLPTTNSDANTLSKIPVNASIVVNSGKGRLAKGRPSHRP